MANQLRTFTGGLDTDTAPHLMKEDTYSSAMNVHVALNQILTNDENGPFNNDRANEGILNMIAGNVNLSDLLNTVLVGVFPGYDSNTVTCVGYAVDEAIGLKNERYIYLFLRQGHGIISSAESDNSFIVKGNITFDGLYNTVTSWQVLLMGTIVADGNTFGDGLKFGYKSNLIARVTGDLLIFTDGINPVRYVDISIDYFLYTPLIPQNTLTLGVEPPIVPLTASRRYADPAGIWIYTGDPAYGTIVQKQNYQFTYRTTNTSNLVSVLSPYSFTVDASRQQDIDVDPFVGNRISIVIEKTQTFSEDTKIIDVVSRSIPDSKFQIIYQWNIDDQIPKFYSLYGVTYTDAQAIQAHNDPGNPFQLYVNGWDGTNILETLDDVTANKPFDSLPLRSFTLETAANRLFLGNNIEGYDTPLGLPAITTPIDITTYSYSNASTPHPNVFRAYAISIGDNVPASKYAYCLFIRDTTANINYALPKSFLPYGVTTKNNFSGSITGSIWLDTVTRNLPQSISFNQLIKLNEQGDPTIVGSTPAGTTSGIVRNKIMNEINPYFAGFNVLVTFPNNNIWIYYDDAATQTFNTIIYNDADYLGPSSQSNAFLPNSSYNIGIQFYDTLFRKSGVKKLGSFAIPEYNPDTQDLIERASFFMPGGPQTDDVIPPWAKYYSITQSKNTKASNFISFSPTALTFAYETPTGEIVYNQSEVSTTYKYYGLAIPLTTLNAYGLGYTFAEGDLCELNIWDRINGVNQNFTTPVINSQDGYAIVIMDKDSIYNYVSYITNTIQFQNPSGTPFVAPVVTTLQADFYVTLYTPENTSNILYELSAFGPINGPLGSLEFGNFYPNFFFGGSLECQLIGDTYTQARNGCGSMVGTSMNTYEKGITTWATNLGRVTPIDLIGSKWLTNSVRWSNVRIPNSNQNGLASFDALNEKTIDANSGAITSLMLTTKDSNLGSRMLILARSGSYIALLGQQQVYSQDQTTAFVAYADVMGSITPVTGGWGCVSPKSVVTYKGVTFWADALNKEIIQLAGDEAKPISQQGAAYLWQQVFNKLEYNDGNIYSGDNSADLIRCGIYPYTFELFVTVPSSLFTRPDYGAECGTNNINQYIPDQDVSYIFNFKSQTWQGAYQQNPDAWIRVGDDIYSTGRMYVGPSSNSQFKFLLEFINYPGLYNQFNSYASGTAPIEAWVTFPMNKTYPQTIEPLSLSVLDASTIKNIIVYDRSYANNVIPYSKYGVGGYGQIAKTNSDVFQYREGEWILPIYRNRFSNNAGDTTSVTQINITTGGSGYTVVPNVSVSPPPFGGVQATAIAVTNGNSVINIIITNPGSGYTAGNPFVIIDPPATVGVQATAVSVLGALTSFDQAGVTGDRIRCKTPFVQMNIGSDITGYQNQLNIQSVKMEYKQSTGH
jgi:hypothetical protein